MLAVRIRMRTGLLLDGITVKRSSQKKPWNQAGGSGFRLKKRRKFSFTFQKNNDSLHLLASPMSPKNILENLFILPPKAMLMLFATAVLLVGGYFFTLYAMHGFSPDFLEINKCVESGGRWNYKSRCCEQVYESKMSYDQGSEKSYP
jgi:hypothetical protein